jgi:hypothetical protein
MCGLQVWSSLIASPSVAWIDLKSAFIRNRMVIPRVEAPDFSPGERVFKPAETLRHKSRALALVAAATLHQIVQRFRGAIGWSALQENAR